MARAEIGSHRQPYRGPTPFPPPLTDEDITRPVPSYTDDDGFPEWDDEPPETGGLSGRILFDERFWTRNREGEQWLVAPFLALGRSHALYAPAKAGKSLLALEIAAAIATGRSVLDQPAGPPRAVLYVDFEMTEDDLFERLTDLGYGLDDDLSKLHYHLHPVLAPLDSAHGGLALVEHAVKVGAELVVVDTVARTISGEENKSDTIIALARFTFQPLKAHSITSLRVDHAGKDLAKGQRGTSSKNDDVDVVWQLTVADDGAVTLKATHRRLSWVPEVVNLQRSEFPLAHKMVDHVWPAGTAEGARRLDEMGAPYDLSGNQAQKLLKINRQVAQAAVKWRREQAGTTLGTTDLGSIGNHPPEPPSENDASPGLEPLAEPPGTTHADKREPGGFYVIEPPVPSPTEKPRLRLSPEAQERWDTEEF